ncbi:hypothetical protein Agsp01_14710 [Agromyces sp. NBRC 114283]|nr:hypothetical protein Agsp01_14710 [Agromyces sp. NBRC 114283]
MFPIASEARPGTEPGFPRPVQSLRAERISPGFGSPGAAIRADAFAEQMQSGRDHDAISREIC